MRGANGETRTRPLDSVFSKHSTAAKLLGAHPQSKLPGHCFCQWPRPDETSVIQVQGIGATRGSICSVSTARSTTHSNVQSRHCLSQPHSHYRDMLSQLHLQNPCDPLHTGCWALQRPILGHKSSSPEPRSLVRNDLSLRISSLCDQTRPHPKSTDPHPPPPLPWSFLSSRWAIHAVVRLAPSMRKPCGSGHADEH